MLSDIHLGVVYSKTEFSDAEQLLVDTFLKLSSDPDVMRTDKQIDLVWELSAELAHGFSSPIFMLKAGQKLSQEFSPDKNKAIQFIFADEYRRFNQELFGVLQGVEESYYFHSHDPFCPTFINSMIVPIKEQGSIALEKIKNSATPELYDLLQLLWTDYIKKLDGFIDDCGRLGNMTVGNLLKGLTKNDRALKPFNRFFNTTFIDQTANIEMLIKIFNTRNRRAIVYAGGNHIQRIAHELEKLGFREIVDIGIIPEGYETSIVGAAHLNSDALKLLLEKPSFAQQKVENLVDQMVIKKLENVSRRSNSMSEQEFMRQIDEILKGFSKAYIDIGNVQIAEGGTLLHLATKRNFKAVVEKLLQLPGIDVNMRDRDGNTPLLLAVTLDNGELVELLLKHGANPNIVNNNGKTPLSVTQSQQVIDLLEGYGAREATRIVEEIAAVIPAMPVEETKPKEEASNDQNIKIKLENLFNNFNYMSEEESINAINEVSKAAPFNIANKKVGLLGETLLHLAVQRLFDKVVHQLLNLPDTDINIAINEGTPLGIAVDRYTDDDSDEKDKAKAWGIINLLLSKKANVNVPDRFNNTPLQTAAGSNNAELVKLLLMHGAHPNTVNNRGQTPLSVAESETVINLLKQYGAKERVPAVEEITTEKSGQMPQLVD